MLLAPLAALALTAPRARVTMRAPPPRADGGLRLLEWAGRAGGLAPGQGALVTTARGGLRLAWKAMMRELAPQDPSGAYVRPSYGFKAVALDADAADGAYHLYHGNACPW